MAYAIIVLGSPNDQLGNLLPIAISRCEIALQEYHRIGDCKILCTGGFGQHFNVTNMAHGQYVQCYLESKGIPHSAFLEIALSAFTLEDATLAKPILQKNAITDVVLVTSDFHIKRAQLVFNHILPQINFEYTAAKTLVTDVEFELLIEHEKNAIKRELVNLQHY